MRTLSANLKVMVDAVMVAAKGIRRDFGEVEKLQVSRKGVNDFVTNSDINSEKKIIEKLQKARPGYSILSEEAGEIKGEREDFRFIIDPIDGTSNFIHGIPYFCISVGLERINSNGQSEPIAGVIYNPILDELFTAEKGLGAYLNDERIRVSAREKLDMCMVAGGSPSRNHYTDRYQQNMKTVAALTFGTRCTGSAALDIAYVAAGRYDIFYRTFIKSWDIAAGIVLVREAGGIVSEIGGGDNPLHGDTILATNGKVHKEIDKVLA